jgi:CheY-like chemotaxis protein
MNGVLGMNRLLIDTNLDEEQEELARTALHSGEKLLVLVNDVLDFARLQADRISLDAIPMQVEPLLAELKAEHRAGILGKGLSFDFIVNAGMPAWIKGDRKRVLQILNQLLDNAAKFTHKGGIVVRVTAYEDGLSVAVQDSGIGISEDCQASIFDAFSQVDGSATRRFGGTGLGLAISDHLARQMGGDIQLSSGVGRGSTFELRLPGMACMAPVGAMVSAPEDGELRILVVEDNPINQMLARRLLERLGHNVQVAPDGAAGVEKVRTGDFDLVFMDCQMPVMDGYAATAGIRALGDKAHVPIIALTANAMEGDRERCLQAGMDDYLAKPVSPAELEDAIRRWQGGLQAA